MANPLLALVEALEQRTLFAAPAVWESRGPGGGGAFFAPSFNPSNSNELYVSSDMSGLYHSVDLGKSWSLTDFKQIQGNRTSQVQFTNDPNVLYSMDFSSLAGGIDVARPSKSTDGGAHWSPIASWNGNDDAYTLYADPNNTQNLIVTTYDQLYYSSNGGSSFSQKFSTNSGAGLYVGGAFFDGSNIYVGTNQGLLVSTNGGLSFAISNVGGILTGQSIFSFAGAKEGATTRLYAVTFPSGDVFPGTTIEGIAENYQSIYSIDVGDANWTVRTSGIAATDKPSWISAPRNDIGVVYVAGASTGGTPSVYKSTNGAVSWSKVLNVTSNGNVATGWQGQGGDSSWGFGELAMSFQVSPTDPKKAAFTDFGYVHLTHDGGLTWKQAYVSPADQNPPGSATPKHKAYHGIGLEDTSALSLVWADANTMVAGYTDITGVRSTDAGQSWAFPTYNPRQNTIYNIARATGGTLYAASSSIHDLYQSTYLTDARIEPASATGQVLFSTDNGSTWNTLHDFSHPVIWFAIDPSDPNRAYASVVHHSAGGIFTTSNLSAGTNATWTLTTAPPRTEGHPFNIRVLNDGSVVASYSGRRTSVFTASSGVFYSTNHGQSWNDRTDTALTGMKYWTKDITIDPTDPTQNTWWAAVRSGFGGTGNDQGGLYKTTDKGLHWTRVFSTDSVESVTINPATREMYIATLASGLWYAPDASAASLSFSQTSYPFRQPERIFINPFNTSEVWIASFGYGLAVGTTALVAPKVNAAMFDYTKKANELKITFSTNLSTTFSAADVLVRNLTTNQTYPVTVNYPAGPTATLTFATAPNGTLPEGNYRITLTAAGITDPNTGIPLDGNNDGTPGGDYAFDFYTLSGDANRDRKVDISDLYILTSHWQQPGQTFNSGDFNYDTFVDAADLAILSAHWQQILAQPANAAPVALTQTSRRRAIRLVDLE